MKIPRLYFYLFLCTGLLLAKVPNVAAQLRFWPKKARLKIARVRLDTVKSVLRIKYHLQDPYQRFYKVRLMYYRGGEKPGPVDTMHKVIGDVGSRVKPGNNKEVIWSFLTDNSDFDGQEMVYKIEAIELPKVIKGGPKQALRSLLLPGLGDHLVHGGYVYGWVTVLTGGLLAASPFFYIESRKFQRKHDLREADDPQTHEAYFRKSEQHFYTVLGFLAAGFAVWTTDALIAIIKGFRNQRRATKKRTGKAVASALFRSPKSRVARFSLQPTIDPLLGRGQITLLYKF